MYLKTLPLRDIHPYEHNPRINDSAVGPVMKSIQKDGYRARIIVDKDGVIIAGHTRYKAMQRLGWTEAEVWIADDMTPEQIAVISANMRTICEGMNRALSVEEIQDLVENQIMNQRAFAVARNYITYRYKRALIRKSNSTDQQILTLLEYDNEEVKQENSNKNPAVNSVQRDYMAGEVSKDITKRFLLEPDIWKAHEEGIIHFHDADYFAQHMHNCCLVNLEDMLMNGTVISGVMIEQPKSFSTACNIATQSVAQIASSQYGGQSFTLSHLVPFVEISRKKYRREVRREMEEEGIIMPDETINEIAEKRLRHEIRQGVQDGAVHIEDRRLEAHAQNTSIGCFADIIAQFARIVLFNRDKML